ncbi:urease accessory protein UreF [Bacillus sp. CECT 9360]|uniref:urease accessory protein UreF n=1 Tax=Bacillus sp. CECT 9360 TaxID=2845821 RepID=UPI001E511413|nr:urease accessory protein UreF [Bacillus sp. CECT 9360]CAH0346523.1 Urease accessory protein UreF [Bacillus sp. CECT 9360]
MTNAALTLMQICDSNFPTGSFSHSYGLETYIQEGKVTNAETFAGWLHAYLEGSLCYNDGLSAALLYDGHNIHELDRLLYVSSLSRETREGAKRVGGRMVELLMALEAVPALSDYRRQIKKKEAFGHPALAFGLFCNEMGIGKGECVTAYLYTAISSIIQNAVRGIPLGQTDGQRLLFSFQQNIKDVVAKIDTLTIDDFGISPPGIELAAMLHEDLHVRLFMS